MICFVLSASSRFFALYLWPEGTFSVLMLFFFALFHDSIFLLSPSSLLQWACQAMAGSLLHPFFSFFLFFCSFYEPLAVCLCLKNRCSFFSLFFSSSPATAWFSASVLRPFHLFHVVLCVCLVSSVFSVICFSFLFLPFHEWGSAPLPFSASLGVSAWNYEHMCLSWFF